MHTPIPAGFANIIPYFYPIYFAILLIHRDRRDEHMCYQKVGGITVSCHNGTMLNACIQTMRSCVCGPLLVLVGATCVI